MAKKNDLAPRQKAFAEFDQALRGLAKLTTPPDRSAVQSDESISEIKSKSSFRDGLMEEILADQPGLSRETLNRVMSELGF